MTRKFGALTAWTETPEYEDAARLSREAFEAAQTDDPGDAAAKAAQAFAELKREF